ncbi:MAG: TMEM165/GDT1 family protein, partial [Brevinematia bacterium]
IRVENYGVTSCSIYVNGIEVVKENEFRNNPRPQIIEKEINLKLPDFLKASLIFFIAEMGDKTQLATFSLSISQSNLLLVWLGATLGLILPNVIITLIGSKISEKLNPKIVKFIAASVFILIGALTLLEYFGIIE